MASALPVPELAAAAEDVDVVGLSILSGSHLPLVREVTRRMREAGLDEVPVVVYHSHTATEAYPSRTDISYASEPEAHYVLVSTRETGQDDGPYELRSYRIVDGVVTEEPVEIV